LHAVRQEENSGPTHDRDAALDHVRKLLPLRHLSDPEFATISNGTRVENCATGNDLFRAGQDDRFIFYLLSGEIAISDAEGASFNVAGGGIESRFPLSPHPHARVKATARTPVRYIRFPANLMRLHREDVRDDITLEEITQEDAALDKRVLFDVYHALMNGELVLPSLPDVAIRIRAAANNEKTAVEDVARIIQADAGTAAYCISVANNVAYAGSARIDNTLDAVVRMGIKAARDLVVAYTIRSLFKANDRGSMKLMREAWKHSCRIAALSYILARDVGRLNPERALLAGLLHDIGVTVLINELQTNPSMLNDTIAFRQLCHALSGQIGAMILRAWKFPDVFAAAALEAEFFAKPVADRLHLGDVVVLAHLHDQLPAPWSVLTPNLPELAIYSKLRDHDTTEDCRLAVIEQADRELAELTRLLSS
jgi:HD-like signal output (HDOD) protein